MSSTDIMSEINTSASAVLEPSQKIQLITECPDTPTDTFSEKEKYQVWFRQTERGNIVATYSYARERQKEVYRELNRKLEVNR